MKSVAEAREALEQALMKFIPGGQAMAVCGAVEQLCRALIVDLSDAGMAVCNIHGNIGIGATECPKCVPAVGEASDDDDEFAARKFWEEWTDKYGTGHFGDWTDEVAFFLRVVQHGRNAGKAAGEREERERAHRERLSRETEGERLTRQSWEHALAIEPGESSAAEKAVRESLDAVAELTGARVIGAPLSESAGAKCGACGGNGRAGKPGSKAHGWICQLCLGSGRPETK